MAIAYVYVLDENGNPLMPTARFGHVRVLLKKKKAVVVSNRPFTIKLQYDSERYTQPITLGIDPGRTNIGIAAVTDDGNCVFAGELITRNKDVTRLMAKRKEHRQASREGERKRRQRRARKNLTIFEERERILPGCNKPVYLKYIINSESRFNNRKLPDGWLTPTANHCVLSHINFINKVNKILPITRNVIEVNAFDFHKMINPGIQKSEYGHGKLFGFKNANDLINHEQKGKCLLCERDIEHYHHIVPKHLGGSENSDNIAGLCEPCHALVHKNENNRLKELKSGMYKKYSGASILNTATPFIAAALVAKGIDLKFTNGYETYLYRKRYSINKSHINDAYCIACSVLSPDNIAEPQMAYIYKQYRRHDRAAVHKQNVDCLYKLDGKTVARNKHKRFGQKDNSLTEYKEQQKNLHGEDKAKQIISKLTADVRKPEYKNPQRALPGAVFKVQGNFYILKGIAKTKNGKPEYYNFEGCTKAIYHKKCTLVAYNTGICCVEQSS